MNKSKFFLWGAILSGIFLIIDGAGAKICYDMVAYGDEEKLLPLLIALGTLLIAALIACSIGISAKNAVSFPPCTKTQGGFLHENTE